MDHKCRDHLRNDEDELFKSREYFENEYYMGAYTCA